MRTVHALLALLELAAFAHAAAAAPTRPRLTLLSEAEVRSDSIYLSDLLPASAPAAVRNPAHKISLGAAPQPGGTRILGGTMIAGRIDSESTLGALEVPQQIIVHRAGRPITSAEVLVAIRSALQKNGFPQAATLEPEDMRLTAPVMVSTADPDLQVTRMDFDPALKQIRFLLWPRGERTILPFLATARVRGDMPGIAAAHNIQPDQVPAPRDDRDASHLADGAPSGLPARPEELIGPNLLAGAAVRPAHPRAIALVEAGKPATLRLIGAYMQMVLEVIPLERGIFGQSIRVRLPATGRVLCAQVVGAGHLEALF